MMCMLSENAVNNRLSVRQEEYDFSRVPNTELEDCLYYEYMRESEAIVREVGNLRRQLLSAAKTQKTRNGDVFSPKMRGSHVTKLNRWFEPPLLLILAGSSEFPRLPWQVLPTRSKQLLRNFVKRAKVMFSNQVIKNYPPIVLSVAHNGQSLGHCTLNEWKQQHIPRECERFPAATLEKCLVTGFFQLNLNYTVEELVQTFRNWLKDNHPQFNQKPERRKGRVSMHDQLRALGALRLRFSCRTLREAQKYTSPPLYSDRTAWKRGCNAAVKTFQSLLGLPEDHQPIHISDGWQK